MAGFTPQGNILITGANGESAWPQPTTVIDDHDTYLCCRVSGSVEALK